MSEKKKSVASQMRILKKGDRKSAAQAPFISSLWLFFLSELPFPLHLSGHAPSSITHLAFSGG